MHFKKRTLPIKSRVLLLYVTVCFVLMALTYLVLFREAFIDHYRWLNLIVWPVVLSFAITYASRSQEIVITGPGNIDVLPGEIHNVIASAGMQVAAQSGGLTVYESQSGFYRLFRNWFGSELLRLSHYGDTMIITGPGRYIDIIASKLQFGK